MRQIRVGHSKPVPKLCTLVPKDFDEIEATEHELVRQVQHGHAFTAESMAEKPAHGSIYSL